MMPDSILEILLKSKDDTKTGFLSANQSINTFKNKTQTAFAQVGGYVKKFTDRVFSIQGALGAAAGAAGLGYFIDKSLKAADVIGKTADRIGISTSALQEYRYAAGISGVETAQLDKGLEKFSKTLGETRAGTGALTTFLNKYDKTLLENIKNSKSADDALKLIFDAMGNAADEADRAALAAAAFGRAGVAMTVMVKDGAEGLNKLQQEARDLGIILDENLIRASEKANDEMSKLVQVIKIQFMAAAVGLAPEIAKVAQYTTDWWKANQNLVKENVKGTIDDITDSILKIKEFYDELPDGVIGPAGYGLIGTILLGPYAGATVALVALVNEQTKKFYNENEKKAAQLLQSGASVQEILDAAYASGEKFFSIAKDQKPVNVSDFIFDTGIDMSSYSRELSAYHRERQTEIENAAKENAKWFQYEIKAAIQSDKEYLDAYADYVGYESKINKENEKNAAERAKAYRAMYKDLGTQSKGYFEDQLKALEKQRDAYIALTKDEQLAQTWFANEYEKLLIEQGKASDNFFAGIQAGLLESKRDWYSWGEAGYEVVTKFVDNSKNLISDSLFSYIMGDMDEFEDAWESLWESVVRSFTDAIAEMLVSYATSGITGLLGIGGGSGGGSSAVSGILGAIASGGTGGGGGSSILSGGGLIGKLSGLFGGGTTGAVTGYADVAGLAAAEAGAASGGLTSTLAGLAGPIAGLGIAAIAYGMFSAMGSSPTAPSARLYLDAWMRNLDAVPGWEGYDAGHGGYGWQNLITRNHIANLLASYMYGAGTGGGWLPPELIDAYWNRNPGSIGVPSLSDNAIGDVFSYMIRTYGVNPAAASHMMGTEEGGEDPMRALWISALGGRGANELMHSGLNPSTRAYADLAKYIHAHPEKYKYEDPTAHAEGGFVSSVIRPPGINIPSVDDGLVSAQVGELILSKSDIMEIIRGGAGKNISLNLNMSLVIDGNNIGYVVADQFGKNIELIEAARRAVKNG